MVIDLEQNVCVWYNSPTKRTLLIYQSALFVFSVFLNITLSAQFDREHFSEVFVDLKWFESKVGNKYLNEAAGIAAEEARNNKQKKRKVSVLHALFWK